MRRPPLFLVVLAVLVASLFAPWLVQSAAPATPPVLHLGSTGKRVRNLQWLLSAHAPSHFRSLHTYYGPISGRYGHFTAKAVYGMKYRLGYPRADLSYSASDKLLRILQGKERRPLAWIARAARRQAGLRKHPHRLTSCQQKIVNAAVSQLGVHEQPLGSNWGPQVRSYLAATGIYYPAQWCVAFAQWVLKTSGYGTIADHSASTGYIRSWAYARRLLTATPQRGDLVLFGDHHTGVVVSVGRYGFQSIEGNYADGVYRVNHSYSEVGMGFVVLRNCPSVGPIAKPTRTTSGLAFAWWQIVGSILAALFFAAAGRWHWKRRVARKLAAELEKVAAEDESKDANGH